MRREAQSASDYKRLDAGSYDDAAAEFDRLTKRFNEPLANRIVELAGLQSGHRVLDVGTGTGVVALRAAAIAKHGMVVGIDHSAGMLEAASAEARRSGFGEAVVFRQMDAEQLDFPDRSFDIVVSLYALFHFPDPLAAVREMHRVLQPRGRVVIGVGAGPSLCSWDGILQGAKAASERVAAARGRLLIAPQFLLRLMRERGLMTEAEHEPGGMRPAIARILQQAGFQRVYRRWQGHCEELDPEEFWRLQVTYASPARVRLRQASPDELATLEADFLERCRTVKANHGKLIYPHAAMFYAGIRG